MEVVDLSNATLEEASEACDHIFLGAFGKYEKVHAFVESVTRTNNRDKIILRIQNQKTWRIAFSLHGFLLVVKIVSGNHIIVAEQECEFYLSNITFPKFGGDGVELEAYADEAKDFLRAHLIGRQVHVQLEYSRKPGYGSVFIGYALDSQNVSELVVSEGLDTALRHNDIIDLSNATRDEAGEASDYIFVWAAFDKYEKVQGVVESVISANNTSGYKIILQIQRIEKTWKIAFTLDGVTCPRGNETYADEAFQLLKRTILQRRVEVELRNIDPIDMDGYFVGTLLESNTHVAIPLLQAGLAKLGSVYHLPYSTRLTNAQNSAKTKKLKIWENYVEPSSSNNN